MGPEAATPAFVADATPGEGSRAAAAPDEGQAKAVIAPLVQPSVEAHKNASAAGETGRDNHAGGSQAGGSPVAIAPFEGAAADPLGEALAALEDRDYATAQRFLRRSDGKTPPTRSGTRWRPSIARTMRRLRGCSRRSAGKAPLSRS